MSLLKPLVSSLEPLCLTSLLLHLLTGLPAAVSCGFWESRPVTAIFLDPGSRTPAPACGGLEAFQDGNCSEATEKSLSGIPLPLTVPCSVLSTGAWVRGSMAHIQVRLFQVTAIHEELGAYGRVIAFGEHLLADLGDSPALSLKPLLLLSTAQLQVGPAVPLGLQWLLGASTISTDSPWGSGAENPYCYKLSHHQERQSLHPLSDSPFLVAETGNHQSHEAQGPSGNSSDLQRSLAPLGLLVTIIVGTARVAIFPYSFSSCL